MNDITPEEAIANLNHIYGMVAPDIQRSLDVAIKALEERPKGKWIEPMDAKCYKCSVCGKYTNQEYGVDKPNFFDFCPKCGADMKGGAE